MAYGIRWEILPHNDVHNMLEVKTASKLARSRIFGGWLVAYLEDDKSIKTLTFVPDPEHEWDGESDSDHEV